MTPFFLSVNNLKRLQFVAKVKRNHELYLIVLPQMLFVKSV